LRGAFLDEVWMDTELKQLRRQRLSAKEIRIKKKMEHAQNFRRVWENSILSSSLLSILYTNREAYCSFKGHRAHLEPIVSFQSKQTEVDTTKLTPSQT
jgi:hypothetical protein